MKRISNPLTRFRFERSRLLLLGLTLAFLNYSLNGCIPPGLITKSVDDVIAQVDKTRQTIASESSAWRDEIPKLVTSLNGMESQISSDAKGILSDTTSQVGDLANQVIQLSDSKAQDLISQAGVEFRCNADFVKTGAVAQLQAIIDDLKFWKQNKTHSTAKPNHAVCWINPSSLTLYPSGNGWLINTSGMSDPNVVHVFGYNFWSEKLPVIELSDANGQKIRDLTLTPAYVTHYQINLDFSTANFQGIQSGARVTFRWPDLPDPNTISLLQTPPANLTITGVSWSKSNPVATQDQLYPTVTIKNSGGMDSTPFVVNWAPAPNATIKSASVNQAVHAGSSVNVQLPGYAYPVCGSFSSNLSLSNGGASRNDTISVAPYCPTVATPAPDPEKQFNSYDDSLGAAGPFGVTSNRIYGALCDSGYHRSRNPLVTATLSGPGGGCYFSAWADTNDEHSCRATIRLWVDGFSSIGCNIQIYEAGDAKPTSTPPPACSCRP